MKINKIRFANIHSLKGEHEIDFSAGSLAEAGLFAITGATGSGKSTLLDVITLALYNRIPRINKDITKSTIADLGGVMTRNAKHCFAEVEFSTNGNSYRSHWSIEKNRNNNLNSRKQELVEVTSGTILTTGKKTPDENEKIIGLNYEQFVKAMVLSQGEFSKLLKAPRDERNKLLEHITGAKSYRQIGVAVFKRYSEAKRRVEDQQLKLEDVSLLTPEQLEEINKDLTQLNTDRPAVEKKYNTAKSNIETLDVYQSTNEKLIVKNKEFDNFKDELKAFEPFKITLFKHNKLVVHKDLLSQLKTSTINYKQISEQIELLTEQYKSCESSKEKYTLEVSQLIKEDVTDETIYSKLELFRSKVSKLIESERSANEEAAFIQKDLKVKRAQLIGMGIQVPDFSSPDDINSSMLCLQEQFQKVIDDSGLSNLDTLKTEIDSLRTNEKRLITLISNLKNYSNDKENLILKKVELLKSVKKIRDCSVNVEALKKELQLLENEIKELSEKLTLQNKQKNLETHRHELTNNEPCPLCGAKEHPYAIDVPVFDVEESYLKTKKELFQTKNALQIETIANRKHIHARMDVLSLEIKQEKDRLTDVLEHIYNETDSLNYKRSIDLESFYELQTQLQDRIKILDKSETTFRAIEQCKAMLIANVNWKEAIDKFNSTNKKRLGLYKFLDIDVTVQKLLTTITSTTTELKSIASQIDVKMKSLKAEEAQKKACETIVKEVLVKENLKNLEVLQNSILEETRAQRIRKQEQTLENSRIAIESSLKQIKKELKTLELKVDNTVPRVILQEHFEISKTAWRSLSEKIGTLNERFKQDTLARKRMELALKQLEALNKDLSLWKTMNSLIGDSNGKKFSNFVQDLTLEQLIGYANKRLQELSDRYILDIPTAEESDKNDTLKVFDVYMGNSRRSVNTLSGGETFMVSLAMAFALSDLASKKVKIESLFIDEGFGTLDPDTLDQAITILEKMQNEGDKSIGVISHVEALKERITTQIMLEKSSLGFSTIKILQ